MLTYLSLGSAGIEDAQNLNGLVNHVGLDFHSPVMDPRYMQYLQGTSDYPTRGAGGATDPYEVRDYFGTPLGDLDRLHKAQLEVLLAQQKQHELQLLGKSGGLNPGYYGTQSYRLGMPYSGNPFPNSVLPSVGSGSFSPERNSRFTSMMRSSMGGPTVWPLDAGNNMEGRLTSTLLDEFKTNKTRSFELSDIVDHVVEFRYVFNALLWCLFYTCMLRVLIYYSSYIIQYRSVWKSLYPAETRSCHSGRKGHNFPRDYSSCPYLNDRCFWKLCHTKSISL